jgi:demethylmenaquinone methyltransferase/2-methoxy-6-polyprenyl-1,4-benzoquinol methylase
MSLPDKTPARIAGMFDAIAPRYDLLNRVLSLGLDQRWRHRGVAELNLVKGARVLDLCTGTADLAIAVIARQSSASVVGVDFSGAMLRRALEKVSTSGLGSRIRLVRGDATRIPLANGTCDGATIGFGIRNVADPDRALAELSRVLRPRARLAILEFGQPRIPGIRTLYAWYFRYVLPRSVAASRITRAPTRTCLPRWERSRRRTSSHAPSKVTVLSTFAPSR